jgi:hypothetical protein
MQQAKPAFPKKENYSGFDSDKHLNITTSHLMNYTRHRKVLLWWTLLNVIENNEIRDKQGIISFSTMCCFHAWLIHDP